MSLIDLRSDTVTKPTPAMRKAMAEAEVGDDVYAEDPTVNRLEDMLAEMSGLEAGLFMPSGSMSNQVALASHTVRGEEVIAPEGAHIYEYELGALSVISGLVPRLIPAPLGVPKLEDVRKAIHESIHQAPTGLILLENTHNKAGGTVVPLSRCQDISRLAKERNLAIHLDAARGFNAVAAMKCSLRDLCAPFDSVSVCLSKGLAAPVGTVLLGSKAFIERAHRYRKMFGGGMRQAGVIAAAGIVAIETMTERLIEDHDRAQSLAEGLKSLEGIAIDLESVQTNMVYLKLDQASKMADFLREKGILCHALDEVTIRLVTHYHITDQDVTRVIKTMEEALAKSAD